MATSEEMFYRDFMQMMNQRRGMYGQCNLNDIKLPPDAKTKFLVEKKEKVVIGNIDEEYYSKLNGTESLLWGSKALKRRKFDYRGKFLRDSNGNFILEEVPCPHDCVAIISPLSIGVPNKFKSKSGDTFEYVDMITKKNENGESHRFVYIVPKKYCYPIKQTALVLSWFKLKKFYSGIKIALQNGSYIFMYVIPYKPSYINRNYRVIHCKTDVDYTNEILAIKDYWIKENIMFNPAHCVLDDYVKGRENLAYENLNGTEDIYERFDMSTTLDKSESFDDVEYIDEEA